MTNLNCCVESCAFNKSECCCLNNIEVGGHKAEAPTNTCCQSFEEQSGAFTNDAMEPEMHLEVACEAKNCVHNSQGMCDAEHIDIAGISASASGETLCATFHCE